MNELTRIEYCPQQNAWHLDKPGARPSTGRGWFELVVVDDFIANLFVDSMWLRYDDRGHDTGISKEEMEKEWELFYRLYDATIKQSRQGYLLFD